MMGLFHEPTETVLMVIRPNYSFNRQQLENILQSQVRRTSLFYERSEWYVAVPDEDGELLLYAYHEAPEVNREWATDKLKKGWLYNEEVEA